MPDETTTLRFRHLLEAHELAVDMLRVVNDLLHAKSLTLRTGTAVDATLISAPRSTANASDEKNQPVVLRDEGAHWRGYRLGSGVLIRSAATKVAEELQAAS